MTMPKSLLITAAVAWSGLSRRTIYYYIKSGRLTTIRTPCGSHRVLSESLRDLMKHYVRYGRVRSTHP